MLPEIFWVFQKNSFVEKSVEQSKNKECKKRYHKKSATKVFQACVALFWNLASALVLALHCYKLLEKKTSSSYHMEQKIFI